MRKRKEEHQSNSSKNRREFLQYAGQATSFAIVSPMLPNPTARNDQVASRPSVEPFDLEEATIAPLQDGMRAGRFTARSLAEEYLARIEAVDKQGPAINSVIELNPDALAIAEALDQERKAKGARGPPVPKPSGALPGASSIN
ncbi:MAG: hypothetical protein HY314_04700 [Acidobacteria bacterium]|nr:hypothetical protein [Acidobacteriota bacterium]